LTFTGAAIVALIVTAVLTLAILFPYRMRFSVSAREMLAILEERAGDANPVSAREALREVALRHEAMYDFNSARIRILLWCFRGAIVFPSHTSRVLDRRPLEAPALSKSGSNQPNLPQPQWPDISKPDTRGGGGGEQKRP
jgi:hypothetical protein